MTNAVAGGGEPRSEIDELILRYQLEPALGDVMVEGAMDDALITWFLRKHGVRWQVRRINRVNVPNSLVRELGVEVGNRGRLQALSWAIFRMAPDAARRCICVIDRDLDDIALHEHEMNPILLRTDFTSIELYAFNEPVLEKLLRLVLNVDKSIAGTDVLQGSIDAMKELFLVRAALHLSGCGRPMIENFSRCCHFEGLHVVVDSDELITRSAASGRVSVERVLEQRDALRIALPDDYRRAVHGHDIGPVLARQLRPFIKDSAFHAGDILVAAMMGCVEIGQLESTAMFSALLDRTLV